EVVGFRAISSWACWNRISDEPLSLKRNLMTAIRSSCRWRRQAAKLGFTVKNKTVRSIANGFQPGQNPVIAGGHGAFHRPAAGDLLRHYPRLCDWHRWRCGGRLPGWQGGRRSRRGGLLGRLHRFRAGVRGALLSAGISALPGEG